MSRASTLKSEQTLKTIISSLPEVPNILGFLTPPFCRWLCMTVTPLFEQEPNIVEVSTPCHVVGDLHGQLADLYSILSMAGTPSSEQFVFLGDYVDRGKHSVEVICLLFILKIEYPKNVVLLRGNHESREMTKTFGFKAECRSKLTKQLHKYFCLAFDKMPLAALIDQQIFCVHGGLAPGVNTLDDIRNFKRFGEIPDDGPIADLLWSDPNAATKEWGESDRGATYFWGLNPAKKFMEENNIHLIVRGHQVALEGYEFPFEPDRSVVTVFSANCYADEFSNKACYMSISASLEISFVELPHTIPTTRASSRGPLVLREANAKKGRGKKKSKKSQRY